MWGTYTVDSFNCDAADPNYWLEQRIIKHLDSNQQGLSLAPAMAKNLADECIANATAAMAAGEAGITLEGCATLPIFLPGGDNPMPTEVDYNSLATGTYANPSTAHPEFFGLTRRSPPANRDWIDSDSRCVGNAMPLSCDEYPYASTDQGGNPSSNSARVVSQTQNSSEGSRLLKFYGANAAGSLAAGCNIPANSGVPGSLFLVLPMLNEDDLTQPTVDTPMYSPSTLWVCGSA